MSEMLNSLGTNKDSLTVLIVILTFITSIFSLVFSVRNNKAVHYINSVTKNRVEWIENLRDTISKFLSILNTEEFTENFVSPKEMLEQDYGAKTKELCQLGVKIKLLLNFSDELDNEIIKAIDLQIVNYKLLCEKILNCAFKDLDNGKEIFVPSGEIYEVQKNIEKISEDIIRDFQIYLKSEWNRVKYESQGKKYEKETQEFDLMELNKEYDDPDYENEVWKRFCINIKAKLKRLSKTPCFIIFMFGMFIIMIFLIIA